MPRSAVDGWLASLRGCLTELSPQGWNDLHDFDAHLGALVGGYDLGPTVTGTERSQRLLRIRADLARSGHVQLAASARAGPTPVLHPLMQFICGYYDLDLRDAVGLGHGQLIASHATSTTRDRWIPCLLSGGLAGIALTERHGGSQIHATRTAAVASDGAWLVTGTKSWISRLYEADVFIVFFVDPDGDLTAAAIDSQRAGLERCPLRSSGLTGWSWGELHLRSVPVTDDDLLGPSGSGTQLIAEHFTAFRPLITATALGAAAAVLDNVTSELATRHGRGDIQRVRDNAAMAIGRSHAAINAALLAAVTAYHLAMAGDQLSPLWGCATKAYGVDVAYQAASELTLLVGAHGFTTNSTLAKARRDLNGLLYADGIHDSLYRAAGHALVRRPHERGLTPVPGPQLAAAAEPEHIDGACA